MLLFINVYFILHIELKFVFTVIVEDENDDYEEMTQVFYVAVYFINP